MPRDIVGTDTPKFVKARYRPFLLIADFPRAALPRDQTWDTRPIDAGTSWPLPHVSYLLWSACETWRGGFFAVSFSLEMTTRDLFLAGNLRGRRLWLALGWILVLLVVYLSLTPAPIELEIDQGDKFSHALAYLVLMSWFANLDETLMRRVGLAMGFVGMGIILEFVQGMIGYRSFEFADMGAGAVGVVFGWLLAPPRTPNYLGLVEKFWRAHS